MTVAGRIVWLALFLSLCRGVRTESLRGATHNVRRDCAFARRAYFYVGGVFKNATLDGGTEQEYLEGQMYVERLEPVIVRHQHPLLFIHGLAQTATNWLNTPDGREGWASYYLNRGYVVYLTDQPQRGRSATLPGEGGFTALGRQAASALFTAPEKVNPLPYPQAALHTQWPGSGLPGDSIFDAFYASQVQYQNNATLTALYNNASYVALLDLLNEPVVVVTHSQAGIFGWQLADARPELVAGIVALEPGAGPFVSWTGPPYAPSYIPQFPPNQYGVTDLPLTYSPPLQPGESLRQQQLPPTASNQAPCIQQAEPARRLVNLARVPVIQIVGEASFQSVYTNCIARYLVQAGVDVELVRLEGVGIHGNGHFGFLEMNNLQIAEEVVDPFLARIAASAQR